MDPSHVHGRAEPTDWTAAGSGRDLFTASRHGVAPAPVGEHPPRRGSPGLRRWGIRPKLVAVVLIPTIAALVLGGLRMASALGTSASYARSESLARVLPQVDALVDALQAERDQTVGALSAPPPRTLAGLGTQRGRSDARIAVLRDRLIGVDTSRDATLRTTLRNGLGGLGDLAEFRRTATWVGVSPTSVATQYTRLIRGWLGLPGLLASQSSNGEVTRRAAGLELLASVKEAASQQRLLVYSALRAGGLHGTDFTDLIAANTAQQVGVAAYLSVAPPDGKALYSRTVTGPGVQAMDNAMSQVIGTSSLAGIGISAAQWLKAATDEVTRIGRVQDDQSADLVARLHLLGHSARQDALTSAAIIYLILGLALIATVLVARSILRPLRALRAAALDVAYQKLPETVRQLQDTESPAAALDIAPIAGDRQDEIGEMARAFDAVHSEAANLAGQQAIMRGNVSKMFINLSRRSQSLVERQLRLIDELEAGEQDADQLANLFQLDHLATRMRRNDENLLVLAGADGGRQRSQPVPMFDVLRAASAEVEEYARVRLDAQPGFELAAGAVNDVVHLVAELVENATNFSPPNAPVWLRSRSLGAGGELMIEVEDSGIGMSPDQLAAANDELVSPSGMDVSVSQLMGLFVVGRLAQRHDIRVMLMTSASGGLTAFVRLPSTIVSPALAPPPALEPPAPPQRAPIFEELQSEWFTPRRPDPDVPVSRPAQTPAAPTEWESPGDAGWRVAAAVSAPTANADTVTAAGLPVRVPGRNLVPGQAPSAPAATVRTAAHLDATESRALTSYQQGIHRARVAGQGAIRHREPTNTDVDDQERRR